MKILKVLAVFFTVIVLLLCCFTGYTAMNNKKMSAAWKKSPGVSGVLVDAGGVNTFVQITGNKKPTVVILSALGASVFEWARVRDIISPDCQVVLYERPGYGLSRMGKLPATVSQNAEYLKNALKNAGLKPPFIIVGHSYGGIVAAAFARLFPGEVKSVVLVDPAPASDDEYKKQFTPAFYSKFINKTSMFKMFKVMSELGLVRTLKITPYPMDAESAVLFIEHASNGTTGDTILSEYANIEKENSKFDAMKFPDVKLIVLCREPERTVKAMEKYGVTKADAEKMEAIWQDSVKKYAVLSPGSELIMVKDTTHMMDIDQPEEVAAAIMKALK